MKSRTFRSTDTVTGIKMLQRLLQAIVAMSFPCLAVVSWGWASAKGFRPLKLDDSTVWATPQGSHYLYVNRVLVDL